MTHLVLDKMYVRTVDGMLFNITGYEHPTDSYYASLKYVNGQKWTDGYRAAMEWLSRHHPEYINNYVAVPRRQICEVFDPRERWLELTSRVEQQEAGQLHREAIQLGNKLADHLRLPVNPDDRTAGLGITDSLLWGDGHAASDIDLVVIGRENITRLLQGMQNVYSTDGFERPDPNQMQAPYGHVVPEWPSILDRKFHMGSYRGRLFSVRGMLSQAEAAARLNAYAAQTVIHTEPKTVTFEIADCSDSLLFPAIYRNSAGDELVDYSVVYEGVFRPGDVVRCAALAERFTTTSDPKTRIRHIIDGPVHQLRRANANVARCIDDTVPD